MSTPRTASSRVPSMDEVRLLLLAAGIQSGVVAAALLLASDSATFGRVVGALLLGVGAVGSLVAAAVCSLMAFRVSLLGLVVGYTEQAIAVPWSVLTGMLDPDPWRAAIAVVVYSSLAVLIGVVWSRLLFPVLVFACEWSDAGAT